MAQLAYARGQWMNLEKPGGAVFFVGGGTPAYNGRGRSDSNNGLQPEEPLSTIAGAHNLCVAGRGDTIVLLPGGVTITAAIALNKADVTLTGIQTGPLTRSPSVITCATDSVEMIAVDAANVTVENLTLDHNTTTANVDLIDVGDATASTDFVLRNLFLDMEGSATNTDGINISGDTASTNGLIEGVRIHDADQDGIVIGAGNDEVIVRNCFIYDGVTANSMQYGISNAGDGAYFEDIKIQTDGTAGIYQNGTLNMATRVYVFCTGANTIGVLAAASATIHTSDSYVTAMAAGNVVDYTTSATVPSAAIVWEGIDATDPTIGVLTTPTVGGS